MTMYLNDIVEKSYKSLFTKKYKINQNIVESTRISIRIKMIIW